MTEAEFRASLAAAGPPAGAGLALQALWWIARGDWDRAHGCVQQHEGDPACDLVHAHLHRIEGDAANASYWYRRARAPVATVPAPQEWEALVTSMLVPAQSS
jgi:hypothetical protein